MTNEASRIALLNLAAAAAIAAAGVVWRFVLPGLPWFWWKYGGDVLWGAMVVMLVGACRPGRDGIAVTAAIAAALAVAVELFRLWHAPTLDAFRLTLAGKLLIGRVFSPWNILAYWIGIIASLPLLRRLSRSRSSRVVSAP